MTKKSVARHRKSTDNLSSKTLRIKRPVKVPIITTASYEPVKFPIFKEFLPEFGSSTISISFAESKSNRYVSQKNPKSARRNTFIQPVRSPHDAMLELIEHFITERKLTVGEAVAILRQIINHYEPRVLPVASINPLPDSAPELWANRDLNRRENAPMFIRRVYGHWLGRGLARKDIPKLDDDLYKALSVWLSRHPDDEIVKLLPSQSDVIDNLIERLSAEHPIEILRKLGHAIDARIRRKSG